MKAKQGKNLLTAFFSGKVGSQFVLRNRGSTQVLSVRPQPNPARQPSPAQAARQARFKRAVAYAKANRLDPAYVAAAEADPDRSAYSLALRDYMRPPEINRIEADAYHGQSGDRIIIEATDDFVVSAVTVELRQAGQRLEGGPGERGENELLWCYTAMLTATAAPVEIVVTAQDKAGNRAEQTATIDPGR